MCLPAHVMCHRAGVETSTHAETRTTEHETGLPRREVLREGRDAAGSRMSRLPREVSRESRRGTHEI